MDNSERPPSRGDYAFSALLGPGPYTRGLGNSLLQGYLHPVGIFGVTSKRGHRNLRPVRYFDDNLATGKGR